MDSINTILGDKDFKEPEEFEKLKDYIESIYGSRPEIRLNPKGLVIVVASSGLANSLRLNLPELKRQLNIDQNINIRIR
jgi:hypothetical protein